MTEQVATNVRFPREQWRALKLLALEEGKSMGQVLREALARSLATSPLSDKKQEPLSLHPQNPFRALIDLGASGVTNGASDHDRILYGKSKSEWKR